MLLMKARERPSGLMTRRMIHSGALASVKSSWTRIAMASADMPMSNSATNSIFASPWSISSLFARAPSNKSRASRRIDFPAPDSPVTVVMPWVNSTLRFSTNR